MWQATLIFHPHKNMFTVLSDFSSSYYAIICMFYTFCIFYLQKKNLVKQLLDRLMLYFSLYMYTMYLLHAVISFNFDNF